MSLKNIRDKIQEGLEVIPGLTVSREVPNTFTLPMAIVSLNPTNPVTYDFSAHNKIYIYHFQIWVLVNKGASIVVAQSELDQYIDPTDAHCIKTKVDAIELTPDASSRRVLTSIAYGPFRVGETDYYGACFDFDVYV